jgi:hypothetical protein
MYEHLEQMLDQCPEVHSLTAITFLQVGHVVGFVALPWCGEAGAGVQQVVRGMRRTAAAAGTAAAGMGLPPLARASHSAHLARARLQAWLNKMPDDTRRLHYKAVKKRFDSGLKEDVKMWVQQALQP